MEFAEVIFLSTKRLSVYRCNSVRQSMYMPLCEQICPYSANEYVVTTCWHRRRAFMKACFHKKQSQRINGIILVRTYEILCNLEDLLRSLIEIQLQLFPTKPVIPLPKTFYFKDFL